MKEELLKLAERVEALSGPDRGVDVEIFRVIGAPAPFQFMNKLIALEYNDIEQAYFARVTDDMQVRYAPPAYTASLDAAMTLVPKGWAWSVLDRRTTGYSKPNGQCWTKEDRSTLHGDAATPALALCAAALRALAKEK